MLELTVLGSGTVAPSASRTAAAHWVAAGDVRLLLDCGPGTLHRAAFFGVPWEKVTHVALTHFHPDHWGEFPMLLFALKWGIHPSRRDPLVVIGPRGLETRLTLLAGALDDWVLEPGYPLRIVEMRPGERIELDAATVLSSCKTPHTPESMAYSVEHGGARLVYTGDTGPSEELARWAKGCDLLLAECSLPDSAGIELHLTPASAGTLAREAGARRLVLTHFYPPIEGTDPAGAAARVFPGPVVAARDGDRFTVGER
jgi:ribonuclease BN (tRNA processing enzyme)